MLKPEIIKDVEKSPFIQPKKTARFGRIPYGEPYRAKWFNRYIISFKFLKAKPNTKTDKVYYKNLPMVKSWYKIFKFLGKYFFISFGIPIHINKVDLSWKDKFGTPRFEHPPYLEIYFFKWRYRVDYNVDVYTKSGLDDSDRYWEMYLWWKYYSDENLEKARETWSWYNNGKTTWKQSYINIQNKRHKLLKELGI
jgi:hypothetical protein